MQYGPEFEESKTTDRTRQDLFLSLIDLSFNIEYYLEHFYGLLFSVIVEYFLLGDFNLSGYENLEKTINLAANYFVSLVIDCIVHHFYQKYYKKQTAIPFRNTMAWALAHTNARMLLKFVMWIMWK